MSDTGLDSNAAQSVPGTEALAANRAGQAAEMAMIKRCLAEAEAVSGDQSLDLETRTTKVRDLRRLRNRANEALRELEDDERSLVEDSRYAKQAVAALVAAAKALADEVEGGEAVAERVTQVAKLVDGVAGASDTVLKAVEGQG